MSRICAPNIFARVSVALNAENCALLVGLARGATSRLASVPLCRGQDSGGNACDSSNAADDTVFSIVCHSMKGPLDLNVS